MKVRGIFRLWALSTLFGLLALVEVAGAQAYRPPVAARPPRPSRPPVSPYLDLLRPGGPTFNYYRRIRPELEWRRELQLQSQQLYQLQVGQMLQEQRLQSLLGASTRFGAIRFPVPAAGEMPGELAGVPTGRAPRFISPTGHPATFGDLGAYFPGLSAPQMLRGPRMLPR
jgi:hypothetical protein